MKVAGKRIIKKILAIFVIITLTMADWTIIGANLISFALGDSEINNENILFSTYFDGESKSKEITKTVDTNDLKLNIELGVKNDGYLTGAKLELGENANFKFKTDVADSHIQKIEERAIYLNQINEGDEIKLQVGIEFLNLEEMPIDYFSKESEINLTGSYFNSKNVNKGVEIKGKSTVKITWQSIQDAKALLATELLTNSTYKVDEANKKVVQILVKSKIENNSYPAKNTNIKVNLENEPESVTVHARTTSATNGNQEFTQSNYQYENKLLTINATNNKDNKIIWKKGVHDEYVVTLIYPENTETINTKMQTNLEITTYDDKTLTGQAELIVDKEKDGVVTANQKEEFSQISKGKIYAGEEKAYKSKTELNVDYANVINSITLEEQTPKFIKVDEENREEEKQANIEYTKTTIDKNEFLALFGEQGTIKILDQKGNEVETITKDTQADEQGKITIEYTPETTSLKITTTKPVSEGVLSLIHEKKILQTEYSRAELQQIKKIKDINKVTVTKNDSKTATNNSAVTLALKETESEVSFNVNKQTLVDLEEQELTMQVTLLANSEDRDLYKNPEIKITMPQYISVKSAKLNPLYLNGLKLQDTSLKIDKKNNTISVKLTGEQKSYPGEAVEGTQLQITAKVLIDTLEQDVIEKINLTYTNENALVYADGGKREQSIKLVAVKKQQEEQQRLLEEQQRQEEERQKLIEEQQKLIEEQQRQQEEQQGQQTQEQQGQQTQEQQGQQSQGETGENINVNCTATVSGNAINAGEEVKAGEIIEYKVTLTNNGTSNAENISILATVPENTTLIEVNPKFIEDTGEGSEIQSDEDLSYYIEKEIRQTNKEKISVESGKTFTYTYMVKVNTDITDTKEIQSQITVKQGNEVIKTEILKNKITKAALAVKLIPVSRNGDVKLKSANYYTYKINLYNLTNEEQKNVQVTIKNNDLIDIKSIVYDTGDVFKTLKGSDLTFKIDSIRANYGAAIQIEALIKQTTEDLKTADLSIMVKDSKGNSYRSIKLSEEVEGVKIDAKLTATLASQKNYIKKGEEIKYTITVKNNGDMDAENLTIEDRFSNYLILKNITLNGEKVEYEEMPELEEGATYSNISVQTVLKQGEEAKLEISGVPNLSQATEDKPKVINKALIYDTQLLTETAQLEHYISRSNEDNTTENNETGYSGTENNNGNGNNSETTSGIGYTISGIAWLDSNNNGARDSGEKTLSGIKVYAIDISTNNTAKDLKGAEASTTTNSQGTYTLQNLPKGEFIIVFEYDTQKYKLTTYQAEGVSTSKDSDAIKASKVINGQEKTVAITDSLNITRSTSNIDLGLAEAKTFDLDLEKVVSKMIVTNSEGTKTYNFKDTNLAKTEIRAKNLNNSNVVIEYKMKITNNGDIAGYAKSIVDYMPSSLKFNSSINKDWYQKGGNLYNDSLAKTLIKPGETKVLTLTLTKKMTESNTGLTNNRAEIVESYNSLGIEDEDANIRGTDEKQATSSADVLITPSTGDAISYIALILSTLIIISGTAYLINKKVLMKKIKI